MFYLVTKDSETYIGNGIRIISSDQWFRVVAIPAWHKTTEMIAHNLNSSFAFRVKNPQSTVGYKLGEFLQSSQIAIIGIRALLLVPSKCQLLLLISDEKCNLLLPKLYLYIAHFFGISQNKSWDRYIVNVLVVEIKTAFPQLVFFYPLPSFFYPF